MTNHLDLEEQEQLDQIKYFWKKNGDFLTWVIIIILSLFLAWNYYKYYQRSQSIQAGAMYDEVERAVDSGVKAKIDRAFSDMKDRFPSSSQAQKAGLLVAKKYYSDNEIESSKSALDWVSNKSLDDGYKTIAKLRLAEIFIESKSYDQALKELTGGFNSYFEPLLADRRGDILILQGKKEDALVEYQKSFKMLEDRTEYRHLVQVKLNSLGVDPKSSAIIDLDLKGKK